MQKFNEFIKYVIAFMQSWYGIALAVILFTVWIMFFDQYSIIKRMRIVSENHQIEAENDYFRRKIADDELKIRSMSDSREALEKYARERYQMQAKDEVLILFDE